MHFQSPPYEQAKLISANMGSFYSVAVDLRQGSPTFGQWCGEEISLENHKVMYVPRGFAHGYLTLEDNTILQYCVDNEYCCGI
jgi:dTDP-4-dehydrorhamnose 3,5-epimerase